MHRSRLPGFKYDQARAEDMTFSDPFLVALLAGCQAAIGDLLH